MQQVSAGRKTILEEDENLELFAIRFLVVDRYNAQEISNVLKDSGVPVNYPAQQQHDNDKYRHHCQQRVNRISEYNHPSDFDSD